MFGIHNGGEGKMGVKTFIVEPLPPPRLRGEAYASQFLEFLTTSSRIKDIEGGSDISKLGISTNIFISGASLLLASVGGSGRI